MGLMFIVAKDVGMGGAAWRKRDENETNKMHVNKTKNKS